MIEEADRVVAIPEGIASKGKEASTPKGESALFRIFRFYVQQIRNGRRRASSSRATANSIAL